MTTSQTRYVLGVDVGTGSARAGLFDAAGRRVALASHPIVMWHPQPDHAEQSSQDIWRAIGICIRECLTQSGAAPAQIVGLAFDATCSLVVLDGDGQGLPVNAEGDATRDVMVWMDHRAASEANEINLGHFEVLKYVGGSISPEMQTPKLLWLKRHLPATWQKAAHFFDLSDFLGWRATGSLTRSLCTLVCKWTYLGHENRWDEDYFRALGLEDALERIGGEVRSPGACLGTLTPQAAQELGLTPHCVVAVGAIDAHAGGLGVLGGAWQDEENTPLEALETTLALIGGTSNCHMAVSQSERFVPGVWGPYWGAMVPGMWLQEGGQSSAGAAIDHAINDHAHAPRTVELAREQGRTVYQVLNAELARLGDVPLLTRDLHVVPDFLGNRSPHADARARDLRRFRFGCQPGKPGAALLCDAARRRLWHARHRGCPQRAWLSHRNGDGDRRRHQKSAVVARTRRCSWPFLAFARRRGSGAVGQRDSGSNSVRPSCQRARRDESDESHRQQSGAAPAVAGLSRR